MARVVAVTSVRAPRSERDGRVVVIGDGSFAGDDLFTYRGNFLVLGEALRWLLEGFDDGAPAIVGVTTSEEDAPSEELAGCTSRSASEARRDA